VGPNLVLLITTRRESFMGKETKAKQILLQDFRAFNALIIHCPLQGKGQPCSASQAH
jgi:hypothetical protein